MAANMAVRSMCNWPLSRSFMIILTKYIHCGSSVGDRPSLFDSTNKTIFDMGRTNTCLTEAFDSEFPMHISIFVLININDLCQSLLVTMSLIL